MVEPLIHPNADQVTAQALVLEQQRSVVPLTTWVTRAALDAVRAGILLQIVTPGDAVLTYPLEVLLGEVGGTWVVRDGAGFRDGFTGVPLEWEGERFVPGDGPLPEPAAAVGGLDIQVTTLHTAAQDLELGTSAAAVIRALTGAEPTGWGVAEPATERWSTTELTRLCRARAPEPASLVVVGGQPGRRAVARLRSSRVTEGVLEDVRVSGPVARAVGTGAIDDLAADLAGTVRSMIVAVHPVRVGGERPARPCLPPLPYGVLIGHPVLNEHGVDHARKAPAGTARVFGRRSTTPGLWCRFDGEVPAYEQLTAVLKHFGVDRGR